MARTDVIVSRPPGIRRRGPATAPKASWTLPITEILPTGGRADIHRRCG